MMSTAVVLPQTSYVEVDYPESDGKPMAETDIHRREMIDLITTLTDFFRDRTDVYVAGNLFFYYEPGVPRSVVAPDVFVVQHIPKGLRRIYKLWEEGQVPCMVFEVTSRKTRSEDTKKKYTLYEQLGVQEYILYDPLDEYLRPALQGYRLRAGTYERLQPDTDGMLTSQTLGLHMCREGNHIRLINAATGKNCSDPTR